MLDNPFSRLWGDPWSLLQAILPTNKRHFWGKVSKLFHVRYLRVQPSEMEVLQGFPEDKHMRAWIGTDIRFPQ